MLSWQRMKIIDLTHTLSESIPTWEGGPGFDLAITRDYNDCEAPNLFRVHKIICGAGSGTHIDAPAHVVPGGLTIDKLDLNVLFSDCVVIDVSAEADENYMVAPTVIEQFETAHGRIPPQSRVTEVFPCMRQSSERVGILLRTLRTAKNCPRRGLEP
jgi:kynurenine formamidase